MRSYRICPRVFLGSVMVGIIFYFVFQPEYMEHVPVISRYDVVMKLFIVSGTALFYYVRRKKAANIMIYIMTFVALQITVTVWNHSYIQKALWGDGILLISMCGCIQWGYEYNEHAFLKTIYYLFYALLIVNFATVLLFPEGMYDDARGIRNTNYFLGNYNIFILYMLPAIVFGYLVNEGNIKKKGYFFLWILCFATLYIKRSATSFAVLLLGVYVIFLNHRWTRMIFNVKTYILVNILFFFSVVWNANSYDFIGKIANLLNKDSTFSGRTRIWSTAVQYIKRNWIWGYGCQSGTAFRIAFDNDSAIHCHNLYLNILYQYGIVGLIVIAVIFIIVLHELQRLKNDRIRYFLEAYIGIFMLRGQFEAENIKFEFFMFLFLYLYCRKHGSGPGGPRLKNPAAEKQLSEV